MPGGRPSLIDNIIGHDDTGQPITVADRIVAGLRAGSYLEPAIAATGVGKVTVYEWIKLAGRVRIRSNGEPLDTLDLTAHERRCCEFLNAVEEAEGIYEIGALTSLERLARGGLVLRTVTRKYDGDGPTATCVERTEREETLAPNAQVIQWRLSRRFPARYAQRIDIDMAGGLGPQLSDEDRAGELVTALDAYLEGVADQAAAEKVQPRTRTKRGNGSAVK